MKHFFDVFFVPEVGPVDEHVEELVGCGGDWGGVDVEVFVAGFLPVASVPGLGVVAEAGVAAFGDGCVAAEDDEGVVAVVVDAG